MGHVLEVKKVKFKNQKAVEAACKKLGVSFEKFKAEYICAVINRVRKGKNGS